MADQDKAQSQLIAELTALRQRVATLEAREAQHQYTEDALRRSEATLRSIFRAVPIGTGLVVNRVFQWTNDTLQKMLGYSAEEFEGQSTRMLYESDAEFERMGREEYAEIAKKGAGTIETRFRRRDGKIIDILLSSTPLDPSDLSAGVVFTALDISERERASGEDITARRRIEEALRESEARYRSIVESIPIGMHMYELAPDGKLIFAGANPAADAILGVAHSQFVGQTVEEAFPSLATTQVPEKYRLVASEGGTWHTDQILLESGEIAGAFEVHAFQTAPVKMTAAFLDVTDRKQAEEALHQRTQQLEALRQVGLEIAAQLDIGTLLHSIVARAVELVGGSSGGLYLHQPEQDVLEWLVASGPGLVPIGSALRRGQGLSGKVWDRGQPLIVDDYQHWAGRAAVYEGHSFAAIVGVPVRWGDELLGVLDVLSDMPGAFSEADTDLLSLFAAQAAIAIVNARLFEGLQRRMEELRNAQARLVQSAKMAAIGGLAAGVAHELNNPLTSVLGFAELAMHGLLPDDPIRRDLATVISEARRARDVVRNLLAFSRQGESFFELSDVNQVIQETLALIRRQLEDSSVLLDERYAPDLPRISLANTRMKQVFLNLFTNALQAMPQGGTLTVLSERVGAEIAIRVADTGVGIPAEDLPNVFDPFFTTKAAQQGTGLGLSISLSIVREHGGRLEVESHVAAGTTFTIWLPVEAAAQEVGHGG
jgi:PAS domain S-box-containing protein